MEIKELRLYNIVHVKGSKEPRGVTVEDLRLAINGENPYLTPIPLTEEWLLKLGFNYQEGKYWIDGLCVHTTDSRYYILQEQGRVFIKYVHQLQNLCFALTGKELTIRK